MDAACLVVSPCVPHVQPLWWIKWLMKGSALAGDRTPTDLARAHPRQRLTARGCAKLGKGKWCDGEGLYLVVGRSGARRWVLRLTVHGRRRELGLGPFPAFGLAEARERARELRAVAWKGGDPKAHRDREKLAPLTFRDAALRVHVEHIKPTARNGKHVAQWLSTLERHAFPVLGDRPVAMIDQGEVLRVLSPIWTETPETARRVKQRLHTVFDWARAAGHREAANPVDGIEKGLARQRRAVTHFAAFPWAEMPTLWPRLAGVKGMGATALRFAILTGARSGEVRGATWGEIDLEARVWAVPAERMKAGREHRVPLTPEALAELELARSLALRPEALAFPATRPGRPLSDMTLAAVLKRLEVPATVHGFRSTFRDWAEEATSFPHEVKEAALAHQVRSATERAYRRTDLFEKRRGMMEAWASYLTGAGAKVRRIGA